MVRGVERQLCVFRAAELSEDSAQSLENAHICRPHVYARRMYAAKANTDTAAVVRSSSSEIVGAAGPKIPLSSKIDSFDGVGHRL